jgi:hypothetical protein
MKYWGWIPRLSRDFYIKQKNNNVCESAIGFKQAALSNIGEVLNDSKYCLGDSDDMTAIEEDKFLYDKEMFLSDNYIERLLKRPHKIQLILKKDRYTLDIDVSIKSPIDESVIISGLVKVYSTGIASYEVKNNSKKPSHFDYRFFDLYRFYDTSKEIMTKIRGQPTDDIDDEYIYAMQMHKLIRDIFHKHVHHSTDLLLPPVEANELDEAARKIAELFFLKFVDYKYLSAPPIKPKQAVENLYRAKGEIEYARVFVELHKLSYSARKERDYIDSCSSFANSIDILINRLTGRVNRAHSSMLISTSLFILSITSMLPDIRIVDGTYNIYFIDAIFAMSFLAGFNFLLEFIENEFLPQQL